jgi:hypothetical protein
MCAMITQGLSIHHEVSPSMIFKNLDVLYPTLLVKSGDMNVRVKLACQDLLAVLADKYHTAPHSVCKYLVKAGAGAASTKSGRGGGVQTPWRLAKARLEALLYVVREFGVDDAQLRNADKDRRDVGMTMDVSIYMFWGVFK